MKKKGRRRRMKEKIEKLRKREKEIEQMNYNFLKLNI